jgi:glycosyltransferase involved in cell wall biosynthesis
MEQKDWRISRQPSESSASAPPSVKFQRCLDTRPWLKTVIRLSIVNPETWAFLGDLYPLLSQRFITTVFKPRTCQLPVFRERIEKWLLGYDLDRLFRLNEVVFFEWASRLLALATSRPKMGPIVTRMHRWELYTWAHRVNWNLVDYVILVSEAKREEFLKQFPSQAAKTRVIPVGISLNRFACFDKEFSGDIGTLCHIMPRKRLYDLILLFSELLEDAPFLRLHIAGDPQQEYVDYYHSLQHLVDRLSLRQKVTFHGFVEKPCEWYPTIDIFISHSYSEGLQVAPMEAMASGCYTLSHHWNGAEELLPPDCLYVGNRELKQKLLAYMRLSSQDKQIQRTRMRDQAVLRFDVQKVSQLVSEVIDLAADGRCSAE